MSIILYGPQGTGKPTHAPRIAAYFKLNRIVLADQVGMPGSVYLLAAVDAARFKDGTTLYITDIEPPSDVVSDRRVVSIAMALHCTLSFEMRDLAAFSRSVSYAVDGRPGTPCPLPRLEQTCTSAVLERLGIAPRLQTASMTAMTRSALLHLGWTRLHHQRSGSLQHLYVRPTTH